MDNGGLSSDERQRQTAAEIARKKVIEAYNNSTARQAAQETAKQDSSTVKSDSEKWQQYHTAWQSYYQKYYGEYYAKAAQKVIDAEREKLKESERNTERLTSIIASEDTSEEERQGIAEKLKANVQKKANSKFQLKKKHRRLLPIACGLFATFFILFLQYNRLVFAPIMAYIAPGSDDARSELTAIDPTVSQAVAGDQNKIMIPKLNIDVPVAFGIANDTMTINDAMNHGVAQFRVPGASAFPGEIGNTVISGHSAGDIYSSNQYKFVFSGLERLTEGDLIYIDYNHTRYTYKMTGSRKVNPDDVESLKYDGDKAILTLITCWPVGTSRLRLLIDAEQINPVIGETNAEPEQPVEESEDPAEMPKNEKTFFENVWSFFTGE